MAAASGRVIWITGASSGIGRSLALSLAREGHHVIATARSETRLRALARAQDGITILPCDLAEADAMRTLPTRLSGLTSHLDQVLLNAGDCEYLDFPRPDWSAVRRVMEINFHAAIGCIEAALPLLRARAASRPHLVAIASQVTAAPLPRAEAYGASKAALQYFCDSLRIDLAAEGIDVTVVNPGFVDTPLTRKNDFPMPFLMDADRAARLILQRLATRPLRLDFPRRLKYLLGLSRWMPGLWCKWFAPAAQFTETGAKQRGNQ